MGGRTSSEHGRGARQPFETGFAESGDASEALELAGASLELMHCHSEADVHEVIRAFMTKLLRDTVVIINEVTPDREWLVARGVAGADDTLLKMAADRLGRTIIGHHWAVLPAYHSEVLGPELSRIPGGLADLAQGQIPRPLAKSLEGILGIHDVYTIGISDSEEAHGNLHFLTRTEGVALPTYIIESFARHCFTALSGIRKARALEESRDMLVSLTAQVPGVVYQYRLYPDGSSAFPFASPGMNDIYEVTPEEVREDATPVFGRLHPEDRPRVSEAISDSARTLKPFHIEFRVVLPRQGLRWRLSDALPQRTEDGGTLWYGIISDITDRKLLEFELRESEARLKKAQHYAHIGSWTWDIRTNQLTWSDEMFNLFGVDKATFSGSLADVVSSAIHPDDRAAVDAVNGAVAAGGPPEPLEYRVVWPDGSLHIVWAEAGELLRDEAGNPSLLSGTVQDITERKRAEAEIIQLNADLERRVQERTEELSAANEELMEANARLDEATRAKSDFLASMSHELRTPLNSIIGFSDILVRGMAGPLQPEQEKQVGMINASGKHLLELVNEVLDLSAVEAGKMRIEAEPVDVAALVRSVVDSLLPLAGSKGLELSWTVADGAATVVSDQTRLGQVLFNLVGNAVKFTESGSVHVSAARVGEEVVFAITDTGRGIPPASVDRVFDDFYQVERGVDAKTEGTGLGLTVSKRLMEMMGGSIDVVSDLGVGSTFTVHLPADGA
ncbi:MAG: PAS domain-containing sensor histidine kinase [Coriobacteriia bacterium]